MLINLKFQQYCQDDKIEVFEFVDGDRWNHICYQHGL